MTIEEAIEHCKEVAKESKAAALSYARENAYETAISCKACGQEHEQLAEWLTELKQRREQQKRGRWIPTEYDGYADGYPVYDAFECSECGHEHNGEEDTLTAFCPDCGAKMDGGADNGCDEN
jgi:Zn finger protein HypA/HybF involved in hydrogenase expression